jgi:peptidoglycan/LPS O-acetylase OafA/YrhL
VICIALLFAIVSLCAQVPAFNDAGPWQANRAGLIYIGPLGRIAEFCLGMVTAIFWKRGAGLRNLSARAATSLEAVAVGLCVAAMAVFANTEACVRVLGPEWAAYLRNSGGALAFALVIALFASQRGIFSRICATPAAVLLGEISFSIYLLHQMLLRWAAIHAEIWKAWSMPATVSAFCAVLLLSALAVWRFVEMPSRRQILRLAPAA